MIEGKLYKCSNYYLMIYPTEEMAAAAAGEAAVTRAATAEAICVEAAAPSTWPGWSPWASGRASYWSKRLNCTVRFSEPNETFMYLNESKDEFAHVLFGEKRGWIINRRWLKIEDVPVRSINYVKKHL